MSAIPEDVIAAADTDEVVDRDRIGCLITEVVTPGFDWRDHEFLTRQGLEDLFKDVEGGEEYVRMYSGSVRE